MWFQFHKDKQAGWQKAEEKIRSREFFDYRMSSRKLEKKIPIYNNVVSFGSCSTPVWAWRCFVSTSTLNFIWTMELKHLFESSIVCAAFILRRHISLYLFLCKLKRWSEISEEYSGDPWTLQVFVCSPHKSSGPSDALMLLFFSFLHFFLQARELQTLHNLRRLFVQDLATRVKKVKGKYLYATIMSVITMLWWGFM